MNCHQHLVNQFSHFDKTTAGVSVDYVHSKEGIIYAAKI